MEGILQLPRTKNPTRLQLTSTACFPHRLRGERQGEVQHMDHCHPLAHQTPSTQLTPSSEMSSSYLGSECHPGGTITVPPRMRTKGPALPLLQQRQQLQQQLDITPSCGDQKSSAPFPAVAASSPHMPGEEEEERHRGKEKERIWECTSPRNVNF